MAGDVSEPAPTIDASLLGRLDTMSDEELARTLHMDEAGLVDFAATIAQNPSSTIEPPQRGSADTQGRHALAGLGALRDDRGITSGLEMDRTIGEGGMGIVRLATQRSLGRKVAVKTLRPGIKSDQASLRLLREAWVTGTLEHPNIVPVYDLGLDESGAPIIVLKRIEGVEWGEVLRDSSAARERYGAADLLEHNLRILVQLCNAVSLAHAHGVLHRDLKPENVMIGKFGEVYLVDWGIAVSLVADPLGRLPQAADQTEMAGTPCYMAPEMLGALGSLGVHTDVYLLGALLHEVLTGAPPHTGSFKQIVGSILLSTFTYGADVPKELADIARRAMSRQPEERFSSADELRLRLEWYLRHRGSLAISAEASKRLADMQSLVASEAPADAVHDRLYHLFAECRFGFRQALNASSDNETARQGLREAIETVVCFELDRGAAEAAAGALAEIEGPPADLVARVNEALRARAAEKKKMIRLERLDAELDPAVGRRTRVFVAVLFGAMWTVAPQVTGWFDDRYGMGDAPRWAPYLWTASIVLLTMLVVRWGRDSLSKTAINRRMIATVMLVFAGQLALQVGAHLLGLSAVTTQTLLLLVWAVVLSTFATMTDARFWVAVGSFFVAFLVACRFPSQRWNMMSASSFVLLITFVVAWWRPREDRPGFMVRREAERAARAGRPPSVS
jgi:eukaryotic-like serine/threonine-protein kinase